jgi:glutathione S-transferase
MKLFYSPASPFVRKVMIVAAMKGLAERIQTVSVDATKGDATLQSANPMGRLPTLLVDGQPIHDSRVICEYLDSIGTGPMLLPRAGMERWRTLTAAALADGILEAALIAVYERRYRPENMVVQTWLDRQWGKINASLAELEKQPPTWGAHPDYADITLACALGYLDFRHGGTWRAGHPKLVAWLNAFSAVVPSFETTKPKG